MDILWGLLHLDQHVNLLIAQHGDAAYAVLFLIVFCETGLLPLFFLPGDPLLFFCGALCAAGAMSIWVLWPLLLLAAALGSVLNYRIGQALVRRLGPTLLSQQHRWLDRQALQRSQQFYAKYGRITFLLSPFIAVVRTFAPFVGGISSMAFSRFVVCMLAGLVLWVSSLLASGYFFGNIPLVRDHISSIVLLGLALGLGSLAVSALWNKLRSGRAGA